MRLKLVAAISALAAIPALAHAQQGRPQPKVPKPTKAEAQNVVQIVTSDKVKMQAYCARAGAEHRTPTIKVFRSRRLHADVARDTRYAAPQTGLRSHIEPVSGMRKRKLENGEQRLAP
jgi:hypothetical protein